LRRGFFVLDPLQAYRLKRLVSVCKARGRVGFDVCLAVLYGGGIDQVAVHARFAVELSAGYNKLSLTH